MTRPTKYLIRMAIFLAAVVVAMALLWKTLYAAFFNNPILDGLILAILALGIVWNFRMVQRLLPEVRWIETLRQPRAGLTPPEAPKLLAPMASILSSRTRNDRLIISGPAMQSSLDSLSARLDEGRELSRYMTGLLIFLGLLGTFYGLLLTVSSIADVIAGMSVGDGDLNVMFDQLKSGLAKPLHGMGTAFSGSMYGLASALVLGFLDLTAGQAQNRFFNELEEWLASITRFSGGGVSAEGGDTTIPAYVQALLEQTAENLESLQTLLTRGEEGRGSQLELLGGLNDRIGSMTELLRANQQLMLRVAEGQAALVPFLKHVGDQNTPGSASFEESRAMREHLRSIEQLLVRVVHEGEQGRVQATNEIRNELRVVAKTIAATAPGRG